MSDRGSKSRCSRHRPSTTRGGSGRARLAAWVVALALPLQTLPAAAIAAPKKVTPADAAAKRTEAQTLGRDLSSADPTAAGMHYDAKAAEWGDPVLFLDAADAYLDAAEKGSDIAMAEAGIERARIALDLLYFQLDATADKNFRMVETADIADLIARANIAIDRGEALMEEIAKAAEAATVATTDEGEDKKKKKKKRKRDPSDLEDPLKTTSPDDAKVPTDAPKPEAPRTDLPGRPRAPDVDVPSKPSAPAVPGDPR